MEVLILQARNLGSDFNLNFKSHYVPESRMVQMTKCGSSRFGFKPLVLSKWLSVSASLGLRF